jgi:Transposase, Mutator family
VPEAGLGDRGSAHFAEVYGAKVSKDTISRITDKVLEEINSWRARPFDRVYPVLVAVFGGVALYPTPRARSLSPYPARATFVPTSLEAEGRPFDRDPPGTLRSGRVSSRPSTRGVPCPSASPPRSRSG